MMIRPATAADQPRISEIIRAARIFPLGLKWHRFVVAEEVGEIVGVGQMKLHRWGARELGSIAVIPTRQKEGIAQEMIEALLAREAGAVYLTCHFSLEKFYQPFGFRRLVWRDLPLDFKGIALFLGVVSPLASLAMRTDFTILVMGRDIKN